MFQTVLTAKLHGVCDFYLLEFHVVGGFPMITLLSRVFSYPLVSQQFISDVQDYAGLKFPELGDKLLLQF